MKNLSFGSPLKIPQDRGSTLAISFREWYSLGSPFATLEPLILPVGRETLEAISLFPVCGTRVASLYESSIRRATPERYKQVGNNPILREVDSGQRGCAFEGFNPLWVFRNLSI